MMGVQTELEEEMDTLSAMPVKIYMRDDGDEGIELTSDMDSTATTYYNGELIGRYKELLLAAHEILKKCDKGPYVKNALEETAYYDGTDCDGHCLKEDIEALFGIEDYAD